MGSWTSPLKVIAQGLFRPSCKLSLAPGFSSHLFRPFYQCLSPRLSAPGSLRMGTNWNLEMLVLRGGENCSACRKTSRSKGDIQQQTQLTCDAESGTRTQATLVAGECSHHCVIPAPRESGISVWLWPNSARPDSWLPVAQWLEHSPGVQHIRG